MTRADSNRRNCVVTGLATGYTDDGGGNLGQPHRANRSTVGAMKGVLLAILVSACATTNTNMAASTATSGPPGAPTPQQQASGDDEQVCQEVSRPGSLMTRTVCRPKSEVVDDREQMRTWMSTPKAATTSTSTPKAAMGTGR
jgi:hypothetical protein